MANDPKKLFGQEVPEELEPIVIVLDNSDDGLVRFDSDDVKEETLDKLGDHAANITKDAGNDPSIAIGSTKINTRTASGNPAAIGGDNSAASTYLDTFASQESGKAVANFEQSSNSKLLPITIRKGKTDDKSLSSGLDLLEEVNSELAGSTLASAIREVELENNRYACKDEYISLEDRVLSEDSTNVGHVILQKELGKHTPRKWPEAAGDGSDIQFKVKNLKNLGLQALLESSGEYFIPDDTDDFASVVAAKAASSAPGLARLGIRIPVSRFSAASIAEQVDPDFQKNSRFPDLAAPEHFSYGSVNNPLVPFNTVSSTSAGIAAVLLAITISELVKALAVLLGPDSPVPSIPDPIELGSDFASDGGRPTQTPAETRKQRIGSYLGKDKTNPRNKEHTVLPAAGFFGAFSNNFFLLEQTQNDYSKAVARGSIIFFGQQTGGVLGLVGSAFGVGDSFKHVSENPAYYNVLLRMLIRSTTEAIGDVVNSVVGIGANIAGETNPIGNSALGAGAMDIDREVGLESDPTNILNVINSVRESKMLKFMDILAVIGDISLMTDNSDEFDPSSRFESSIDGVSDFIDKDDFPNPAALVKKNRLSSDVRSRWADSLAWGSNTLKSSYLLPASLLKAEAWFTGHNSNLGNIIHDKPSSNFKLSSKNRLSADDVDNIERELDSYYMPFYFQDLRTNEVISFHAFIENIDDSFDAEYTETDGYGRIGKVHTYKNTNRSIGCSFRVVATNQKDFSEMWYKINRFVMLLYPQYTPGRQVSFGTGGEKTSFIQPFSQLIGNSPMVRFRLGDLIKTNFSDFDLARLFGLGTEQFKITEDFVSPDNQLKVDDEVNTFASDLEDRMMRGDLAVGDKFRLTTPAAAGGRSARADRILRFEKKKNKRPPVGGDDVLKVVEVLNAKKYKVKLAVPNPKIKETMILNLKNDPERIIPDIGFMAQEIEKKRGSATASVTEQQDATTRQGVENFFNSEQNPVVKSFDSVRGQGLAGFIKRVSFDWSDARWETEGLNNRAPMWCKIDIDFAPVHDINPGLDSSGAPIGMPYNVGSLLKLMKIKRSGVSPSDEQEAAVYASRKTLASTPDSSSDSEDSALDKAAALNPLL